MSVGLAPLDVLLGIHGPSVDIEIRVNLDGCDVLKWVSLGSSKISQRGNTYLKSHSFEKQAGGAGNDALPNAAMASEEILGWL